MVNEHGTQKKNDNEISESGVPGGGQGRIDEVGKSGIYPVSEMEGASDDAVVHAPASFGQSEDVENADRDQGSSEVITDDKISKNEGQ